MRAGALRRHIPAWLAGAGDALTAVLLPADCRLCERPLIRASRLPICQECLDSFAALGGRVCRVCGLALESGRGATQSDSGEEEALLCAACREQRFGFDQARSVFRYQDRVVRAVIMLKFEEMDPLADWFAGRLAELTLRAELNKVDLVVPVPLHKARQRERGFNQAELLSKRLARRLRLPHQGVLLVRKRPRPDKHLLTERERWAAVRGAFAARAGSEVDKQRVLLVDDVMTTGATLDACAKALREAGATSVTGLTVARAILNPRTVGR